MADYYPPGRTLSSTKKPTTPKETPVFGDIVTGALDFLKNLTKKDTVKPAKTMTGATGVVAGKTTTPKTVTGTKLQATVDKTKPAKLTPGLSDQLALNKIESDSNASEALRLYQAEAAQQQLRNSLATIQRSALQQYEGIANDFASRGMLQSGGYLTTGNRAQANVTDQTTAAQTAVRDFINQNKLQGTLEKGAKQGSVQDILMRLLTEFNSNNINQLGS